MKKLTLIIGIPAFNEEDNIRFLLNDLLKQKKDKFLLREILVVSDGSTDSTEKIVKEFKKGVNLRKNEKRCGLAFTQNLILEHATSDVLILINADVRILDKNFLFKMIQPIQKNSVDLVSPSVSEAEPSTFFEKVLFVSTKIKNVAYENYRDGDNVYTCRGVARAFSKRFYSSFRFSTSIGEDAFSYYNCKVNGFKYHFQKSTSVIFRLPTNFMDHKKQSIRFYNSKELLKKEFGKHLVSEGYKLGKGVLIKSILKNLISDPISTIMYFSVLLIIKAQSFFVREKENWERVSSSKTIARI